ncbi:MAG: hypothetical protein AAGL89_06405 [Pseudomonadota bacterium]
MDAILSRLPSITGIESWTRRNSAKLAGLFAGTVGLLVLAAFLNVAISGEPLGGPTLDPDRTVVYPNF